MGKCDDWLPGGCDYGVRCSEMALTVCAEPHVYDFRLLSNRPWDCHPAAGPFRPMVRADRDGGGTTLESDEAMIYGVFPAPGELNGLLTLFSFNSHGPPDS